MFYYWQEQKVRDHAIYFVCFLCVKLWTFKLNIINFGLFSAWIFKKFARVRDFQKYRLNFGYNAENLVLGSWMRRKYVFLLYVYMSVMCIKAAQKHMQKKTNTHRRTANIPSEKCETWVLWVRRDYYNKNVHNTL